MSRGPQIWLMWWPQMTCIFLNRSQPLLAQLWDLQEMLSLCRRVGKPSEESLEKGDWVYISLHRPVCVCVCGVTFPSLASGFLDTCVTWMGMSFLEARICNFNGLRLQQQQQIFILIQQQQFLSCYSCTWSPEVGTPESASTRQPLWPGENHWKPCPLDNLMTHICGTWCTFLGISPPSFFCCDQNFILGSLRDEGAKVSCDITCVWIFCSDRLDRPG